MSWAPIMNPALGLTFLFLCYFIEPSQPFVVGIIISVLQAEEIEVQKIRRLA